jgi:hypothetical protein
VNTALLTCLLLSNLLLLVVSISLFRRLRGWDLRIGDSIREWSSAPDEKTPSPFAQLVNQVGAVVAGQVGNSVVAAIRGALGGTQKGINAEAIEEAVGGSPGLALVQGLAPKLFRKLSKSPVAMAGLDSMLGKFLGGVADMGGGNGAGQSSNDVAARIRNRR